MTASLYQRGSPADPGGLAMARDTTRAFIPSAQQAVFLRRSVGGQHQDREWRQMQAERMGLPVGGKRKRLHRAEIAYAAAAVFVRVAVEPLAPAAGAWHADPVVVARHRREVADDERAVCAAALAQEHQRR